MDIKKRRGTVISAAMAIGILVLSIMPADLGNETPSFFFPGIDKLIHGIIYFIFTYVVLTEYYREHRFGQTSLFLLLSALMAYSVLMELLQYLLVSSRSGEMLDVLANLMGIFLATVLVLIIRSVRS